MILLTLFAALPDSDDRGNLRRDFMLGRRPIVDPAGIGVSEHHETLTIFAPRNHDLAGTGAVICIQRTRIRGGNTECSR